MKTILTTLFAAVLSLSLLAGCSSSKKPIVGKWTADGNKSYEFTDDGKVTMTDGSNSAGGTYTLPDADHFAAEIDFGGKKKSKTIGYKIDGDTLNLDVDGKKESYKKAK